MRLLALIFAGGLLAGCGGSALEDDGSIDFGRNSQFATEYLRVFLTLEDGRPLSVNTLDDSVATETVDTPIPGHRGREWRFLKDEKHGTSVVTATVSWDEDNPPDYLMAGYWAYYPGQHAPELDPLDTEEYAILDGPEIDPAVPPALPVSGTASYAGPAGGNYSYVPGATLAQRHFVFDGWEGVVTLNADFQAGTASGCNGCVGDLTIRPAVAPASRGDVRHDISDYELHLGEQPFGTGSFDGGPAEVRHPSRQITASRGSWGGTLSNKPDEAGNPRLIAGFGAARYEEDDGSRGYLFGSFVGLSEDLRKR